MGLEINSSHWNLIGANENKQLETKEKNEEVSFINISQTVDENGFQVDDASDRIEIEGKVEKGEKEEIKTKEPQKKEPVDKAEQPKNEKLVKGEETEEAQKMKSVSKEEIAGRLTEIAKEIGMNDEEAKTWVENAMSKAQEVYDNVYEDCINKLKKTPERAEYVANIAYQYALETLIKQAEAAQKEKEMPQAFV